MLLKARAQAKLGVALGISAEDVMPGGGSVPSRRPSSAPSTQRECGQVRQAVLKTEAAQGHRLRPKTCFPITNHRY